ncbi:M24 family metallopeptidase [Candidatus Sodalis pierantonius]|uniref:M24 family metallopeptidase n=1 Tax=Candidatus Sodalis pierantonii TaxID=1486991 RepID=UPI001F3047A5|nr:M24 family metallopeptidase [Candidatus Sodalis pierantonius]
MPESVTWLTGFFTRAYSSFQFAIIPASGAPTVVCRDVEAYYLDSTCCYPDRVMWRDSDDKDAVAVNAIRTRLGEAPSVAVEMAAIDSAQAGVSEWEMAAQICAAMIRAGSDLPGPGVMSSGERAFHLHGGYSDRVLAHGDIVQIETTPNVRHYHAFYAADSRGRGQRRRPTHGGTVDSDSRCRPGARFRYVGNPIDYRKRL